MSCYEYPQKGLIVLKRWNRADQRHVNMNIKGVFSYSMYWVQAITSGPRRYLCFCQVCAATFTTTNDFCKLLAIIFGEQRGAKQIYINVEIREHVEDFLSLYGARCNI